MSTQQLPNWVAEHIKLYQTDPEKAHLWDSALGGSKGMVPTLLLTTKGRKSGKPLPLPLIYGKSGDNFVVIASKGGAPDHPAWYKNLAADPTVEVQAGPKHYRAKARTATGAERDKLWAQLAKLFPPYDAYQKRAGSRQIPVVVLEPVKS